MDEDKYANFMLISIAANILLIENKTKKLLNDARKFLAVFISNGFIIYGPTFSISNVHMMEHVAYDSERFGSLNYCSAFDFENYNGKIKRILAKYSRLPVTQLVNRLSEREFLIPIQIDICISIKMRL